MPANELVKKLAYEIAGVADQIDSARIDAFCDAILSAKRVFVCGRGRSNYLSKCFAMRLTQLGLTCFCIDETNTPAIHADDILIICSGSGESETLAANGRHCLRIGAKLAVVTANAESALAEIAHIVLCVPSYSSKLKNNVPTINIMASQFESTMLLVLDACVLIMKDMIGTTEEEMMLLHKNIE